MSDTMRTLLESLFMIGAISAGFVWYAVVAGRREDRDFSPHRRASGVPRAEALVGQLFNGRKPHDFT
jgi:hypothetical protein